MKTKKIILSKEKQGKSDAIYVRLSHEQKGFLDSTAEKLGTTRSETIRKFVDAIKQSGVKIQ